MQAMLHEIKNRLIAIVSSQLDNLDHIHTKELGEVIDMIKDISEALYYCDKMDSDK